MVVNLFELRKNPAIIMKNLILSQYLLQYNTIPNHVLRQVSKGLYGDRITIQYFLSFQIDLDDSLVSYETLGLIVRARSP